MSEKDYRIGNGWDVHAFESGRPLVLGGVTIPHEKGLAGHSDADALLHAIADSVLGALALGDIGDMFPNNDPQWKNADSRKLLALVWEKASSAGWSLVNCDCMVLLERPKLAPHILAMREQIAKVFVAQVSQISIKATTSEGLGFVGREEGIAASSSVLLVRTAA